jgi:hypothetical protein
MCKACARVLVVCALYMLLVYLLLFLSSAKGMAVVTLPPSVAAWLHVCHIMFVRGAGMMRGKRALAGHVGTPPTTMPSLSPVSRLRVF